MGKSRSASVEARVLTALLAAARALAAEVRRAGASSQLTTAQFFVLSLLAERDHSVSDLARTLRVAMPTVTQSLDSLVAKMLAERYADERDRRQVWLRVTEDGRRLLAVCRGQAEGYLVAHMAAWPVLHREELASALEALVASMAGAAPTEKNGSGVAATAR